MLMSGAETYRVEDTASRILMISGLPVTETYVTATGLILTLDGDGVEAVTVVRRVKVRDTNLNRIYLANQVSRRLCNDEITLREGMDELVRIREEQLYSPWIISLCIIAATAFFSVLYGANILECLCAAVNGLLIALFLKLGRRLNLSRLIINIAAAALLAFLAAAFEHFMSVWQIVPLNASQEMILVGSIMPLVPGVAITNAIRDTLQGDYLSGGARAIEAFVLAVSIAVGVGAGLFLFTWIGV